MSSSLQLPTIPTIGVKGSNVYSSSGDPRVDLNVKLVRGVTKEALADSLSKVLAADTLEVYQDAFVLAFNARNVRGGKGERDIFYTLYQRLYDAKPHLAKAVMDLIPHYGCWSDVIEIASRNPTGPLTPLSKDLLVMFAKQLLADSEAEHNLTLAGKWAPREGSKYEKQARHLAYIMGGKLTVEDGYKFSHNMRNYRKLIASLNAKLRTIETLMCSNKWDQIIPATVPGRAGKLYARAFLNEPVERKEKGELRHPDDPVRMKCRENFKTHFEEAVKGTKKLHGADTLFPHEIVVRARHGSDLTDDEKNYLQSVWNAMVNKTKELGGLGRSIFMCDFSGSMSGTPYDVSMALGILGSQVCSDEFKDMMMTFDSYPTWHHFQPDSDLFARIDSIKRSGIGMGLSTDFQKAMDLVLETLKTKRVRPGEEPENLIVLTDMCWDKAYSSSEESDYTSNTYRHAVKTKPWQTHVEMIQEAFKRAGEDMWGPGQAFTPPRIVIWNLRADPQTDFHATADTPGVAMLSGWSPTQFEILQTEGPRQMTPYETLRLELDHARYDQIRERLSAAWNEDN